MTNVMDYSPQRHRDTETQRHRDTEKASKEESDVLCLSSPPEIVYAWKFIPSAPRKSNENPEFDVYSLVP
jgi:hypothetical protein